MSQIECENDSIVTVTFRYSEKIHGNEKKL